MDGTNGRRQHFTVLATTTPKLLVGAGSRQAVTFVGGAVDVYLGYSGSLPTNGVLLPAGNVFYDMFSSDEWWVATASSSGTITGYSTI